MITFDQARAMVAQDMKMPTAEYGWENDNVYVVALDYGDQMPQMDDPDLLVDKRTGKLRKLWGLLGEDPAPDLRPIGNPPE